MKSCETCRFCLLEDYGWSNYTTEGTTVLCLKRLHPEKEGFDHRDGEDVRFNFAEKCPDTLKEILSLSMWTMKRSHNGGQPGSFHGGTSTSRMTNGET